MNNQSVFKKRELINQLKPGMIAMIGIPFDEFSSYKKGSALAPDFIRGALHSGSANLCAENGVDLATESLFVDLGDLNLGKGDKAIRQIEEVITELVHRNLTILSLGGDHSITYPLVKAYYKKYSKLDILHLDAHADLYHEYQGKCFSHACPFARICEDSLVEQLIQVGIRTMNNEQQKQVERFAVKVISMSQFRPDLAFDFNRPLYLSIDLDVLDPGFAPGVSHYEPGGLTPRELINFIHNIKVPVIGADIVEFNPQRDTTTGMTAMLAAKLVKEVLGKMVRP